MPVFAIMTKKPIPPSLTVFSDDGYIATQAEATWAAARSAPTNPYVITSPEPAYNSITSRTFSGNFYAARSFLYFDLSALPGAATVTSAVVYIRGWSANSQVSILQGTQTGSDASGLVAGDWNGFTGTPFATVNWITGITKNALTLNSSGLSYIESVAGGTAKFCLREYDSDYLDVAPLNNDDNKNGMYFHTATPGTDNDPYITIGYTE